MSFWDHIPCVLLKALKCRAELLCCPLNLTIQSDLHTLKQPLQCKSFPLWWCRPIAGTSHKSFEDGRLARQHTCSTYLFYLTKLTPAIWTNTFLPFWAAVNPPTLLHSTLLFQGLPKLPPDICHASPPIPQVLQSMMSFTIHTLTPLDGI